MDKRIAIAIGIGVLIVLGIAMLFSSNITGNVVTGSAIGMQVEQSYERISDFGQGDEQSNVKGSFDDENSD